MATGEQSTQKKDLQNYLHGRGASSCTLASGDISSFEVGEGEEPFQLHG